MTEVEPGLTGTLRSARALADAGLIVPADIAGLEPVVQRYAVAVPAGIAKRTTADPADPLRRQYIPDTAELFTAPHEDADPIGDAAHSPVPGLVHRYPDRVLLKVTSICPVYCRFCFRREQVGPEKGAAMSRSEIDGALAYIADNPQITEVILTGGDPFMLSAAKAGALTRRIEAISTVRIIRWHTRMPVAEPGRVTADYAAAIASAEKAVFVAVHANHANELTDEAVAACRRLAQAGIGLVSQSVLLRGVNDTLESLAGLMRALLAAGVKPYYLHQLDAAPGTSHFHVPVAEGQALVRALRDTVSGLAVPHYVQDIPGGVSKAALALPDITEGADGAVLRGRDGRAYRLNPPPRGGG
jgi:lysine 2,3-aminomutase